MKKIIVDVYAGSGAWSKYYKINGYDVRIITLPENDANEFHPPDNVYGLLFAPPCDQFSLVRNGCKTPRNFEKGLKEVKNCLRIIWECRLKNKLAFWCLENPTGLLRQFLGKPVFTFQPYHYGDYYSKKTDLWGYFNNPKKTPLGPLEKELVNRKFIESIGGNNDEKKAKRSVTPAGFARAFYEANK